MKKNVLAMMQNEIKNKRQGKPAYIKVKINHITDEDIMRKLYEASAAGVEVDLLVRGNCSLVTGIPGKSDHIRIHGIIDRYLEHSRILIFCNGGDERYYMGSADWMPRNLDNRIEVMTPVYNTFIQEELKRIVEWGMKDNQKGRIADGTGENRFYADPEHPEPFRSQEELYRYYEKQVAEMRAALKKEEA